ncbi:hypothetical protein GOODEAATRI_019271 [Goodea atripinnis]|uniref:Uncharacterized protein n=1 Tax=Goodea atripinnis TaxID=208336 RepID=A0ABV0PFG6_9TELE
MQLERVVAYARSHRLPNNAECGGSNRAKEGVIAFRVLLPWRPPPQILPCQTDGPGRRAVSKEGGGGVWVGILGLHAG